MLPPATKNIVKAVSTRTPVVPRSGSRTTRPATSADDDDERQQAATEGLSRSVPRVVSQWAMKTTSAELGELGGVEGRQPTDAQPARRPVGIDGFDERWDGGHEHEDQHHHGDDHAQDREAAPVPVVEAHGEHEHEPTEETPTELRADGVEDAATDELGLRRRGSSRP